MNGWVGRWFVRGCAAFLVAAAPVSSLAQAASPADPPDWEIRLEAASGLVDRGVFRLAARAAGQEGFDLLDEPYPPVSPRHFLDLGSERRRADEGWASQPLPTVRYRAESVAPLAGVARAYDIHLETDAARLVTLTWTLTPDADLASHRLELVDLLDGTRTDLWAAGAISIDAVAGRRTLRIEIAPGRSGPPVALSETLAATEDVPMPLTLRAVDPDGDAITFEVVSAPAHGTLLGIPPSLTYVPNPDFNGADAFQFRAHDALGTSNTATVHVVVAPVNDAPVATAAALTTDEDVPATLPIPASDVDGDPLTAVVTMPPAHGVVLVEGGAFLYTPAPDFHGSDSFEFVASDGVATSAPARVDVTVISVPDDPRAAFRPAGLFRRASGWEDNLASLNAGARIAAFSSQFGGAFEVRSALDDDASTRWASASGQRTNQSITVALPGGRVRKVHRVRIVNGQFSAAQAVRNFEVYVSATTAEDGAFTRVIEGVAADAAHVQEYALAEPALARFVRLVALDNHGSTCCISVGSFEVVSDDEPGIPSHSAGSLSYSSAASAASRPEGMLDGNPATAWRTAPGQGAPQHATIRLARGSVLSAVRILPSATAGDPEAVRGFEVWTAETLAGPYTQAGAGITVNDGRLQEFPLSQPGRAAFLRLVGVDTHGGASAMKVATFEAVTAGSDGHLLSPRSTVVAVSSEFSGAFAGWRALDLDRADAWATQVQATANQFVTLALPDGQEWRIDHLVLQARAALEGPRDFTVQVSTTTAEEGAFTTVFEGTARLTTQPQHFRFAPAPARYVRVRFADNYGGSVLALAALWIASPDVGSVAARFVDETIGVEGPVAGWQWAFGDGASSTAQDPAHTFAAPGPHVVTLEATDTTGRLGSATQAYRALGAPVAEFGSTPSVVTEGMLVTFQDLSTDPYGIALREWDFGDGETLATPLAVAGHRFPDQGVYVVRLRASNPWGAAATIARTYDVANAPPFVEAGPDARLLPGATWAPVFTISDSAADAPTLSCRLDYGDGTPPATVPNCNSVSARVPHAYAGTGLFVATLSVTDKDGATGSDTVRISVFPPSCAGPGGPYLEYPFCGPYALSDIGSAPGVPFGYTGLAFKDGDPNTLLVAGAGILASGALYAVPVTRDAGGHVSGFAGSAVKQADVPFVDGGLVYGPGRVLFTAQWPLRTIVQIKPGSTMIDKTITLGPADPQDISLNFVPPGFPAACELKMVNYFNAGWWAADVVPDGFGTYDLANVRQATVLPDTGPEHLVYVPQASPVFTDQRHVLVAEYDLNAVGAYEVDAQGDPVVASYQRFITALPHAESATVDPVTGDMLIAEFANNGRIRLVRGFAAPVQGASAVEGGGRAALGRPHAVRFSVRDGRGHGRPGAPVSVSVVSGPNAGVAGHCLGDPSCLTDEAGDVRFEYTGASPGTDVVRAVAPGDSCGVERSAEASVEWAENGAPVGTPGHLTAIEDTPLEIVLLAADPDGDPLTYAVTVSPEQGDLTGVPPVLVYTPHPDYHGPDAFTWTAEDPEGASTGPVAVTISVTPVNDAPTAGPLEALTAEDTPVALRLAGQDPDGDALTYEITSLPAAGLLSGVPPDLIYTPAPDAHGVDSFRYRVSDGAAWSEEAVVTVFVTAVNDPPQPVVEPAAATEDEELAIELRAFDPDGDALSYAVTLAPAHGALTGDPPLLTYTPAPDFNGTDAFEWSVTDGTLSASGRTEITVAAVNDAPATMGRAVSTPGGIPVTIVLPGVDVDLDPLTFEVVTPPGHGTLQGTGDTRTYTPAPGFAGPDLFTFRATDGLLFSNVSTVTIDVTPAATLDCTRARPDLTVLWPPDHGMVAVAIRGVVDAAQQERSATATAVHQDEPVNGLGDGDTAPDATLFPLQLRAERAGGGNGRVYVIDFTAGDAQGGSCTGRVSVCVPHAKGGAHAQCVDDEVRHDSTQQ